MYKLFKLTWIMAIVIGVCLPNSKFVKTANTDIEAGIYYLFGDIPQTPAARAKIIEWKIAKAQKKIDSGLSAQAEIDELKAEARMINAPPSSAVTRKLMQWQQAAKNYVR